MITKPDKIHYARNFEISLIISLLIAILLFQFYPEYEINKKEVVYYGESLITVIDIPTTDQKPSVPLPPKPVIPSLFIEVDEVEMLPDVEIEDNSLDMQTDEGDNTANKLNPNRVIEFSSLPYKPRKSYAHIPKISGCSGEIKLALRIGKDGTVKEYKILINTADDEDCLKRVIDSMYKSRWMPIIIEGDRFEFWIEEAVIF